MAISSADSNRPGFIFCSRPSNTRRAVVRGCQCAPDAMPTLDRDCSTTQRWLRHTAKSKQSPRRACSFFPFHIALLFSLQEPGSRPGENQRSCLDVLRSELGVLAALARLDSTATRPHPITALRIIGSLISKKKSSALMSCRTELQENQPNPIILMTDETAREYFSFF